MELTKKTTILFPPDLHDQLAQLARQGGTSLGELVRQACRAQYGLADRESRMKAVRELSEMSLPVGTPEEMERESVPGADLLK